MRHFWIAAVLVLFAFEAVAQEANVVSEPERGTLLEITREWSALAGIGDLRSKPFGEDDIELRVWGGYGLTSTIGAVLRRINGEWEGLGVHVEPYRAASPDSLASAEGVLPPCVVEAMSDRCIVEGYQKTSRTGRALGTLYNMECPYIRPVHENDRPASYAGLWEDLVEAGMLVLPPEIEREWIMTDGHSYVVEVRTGDAYRASSIAHVPPEVEADRQVQAIAKLLNENLLVPIYSYWDEHRDQARQDE